MPSEDCDDGVDNDCDGSTDCADDECHGELACCGDGNNDPLEVCDSSDPVDTGCVPGVSVCSGDCSQCIIVAQDLALQDFDVQYSPTHEGGVVKVTAKVENFGEHRVGSYKLRFEVLERKNFAPVDVVDSETGSTVRTKVLDVPGVVPGASKVSEWSFVAPEVGDYFVKAEVEDVFHSNNLRREELEVVAQQGILASEYDTVVLLIIIVALPLTAYFFLKKQK
jgi:hypothetical protein